MMVPLKRVKAELLNLYRDIKKDLSSSPNTLQNKVFINGLAKSGTSLFEHIVSELGYVDGARSLLRARYKCNRYEEGFICSELFNSFPSTKKTYIKTHAVYDPEFNYPTDVIKIIVLRDIRDALVSRYYHVISDPRHWDYNRLISINSDLDRFKASVFINNPVWEIPQFEYYAMFVDSWVKSPFSQEIFWYEDYLKDPLNVISKIKEKLHVDNVSVLEIEQSLDSKRTSMLRSTSDLGTRRKSFSAQSATFRSGKSKGYLDFFDDELNDYYEGLMQKYMLVV